MLGDTPDGPSTRSILLKDQGPKAHLLPLNTVEDVHKLEEALHSESITTAKELKKSLHLQDLSDRSLFQN